MSEYEKVYQSDSRQGQLFNPDTAERIAELKRFNHELEMLKDMMTAVLNRIDAVSDKLDTAFDMIEDLSTTLLDE